MKNEQCEKDKIVFIYGLVCPIENTVRYVGKSVNPHQRFKAHVKIIPKENTHKSRWIKILISKGLLPKLVILEIVNNVNWQEKERFWISKLKEKLTNESEGGDGREKGFKHKPEAVKKIVFALKNRSKELRLSIGRKTSLKLKGVSLKKETTVKLSVSHKKYWSNLTQEERDSKTSKLRRDWTQQEKDKLSKTNTGRKTNGATSKYRGVSWFKRDGCWRAWLKDKVTLKQLHLGYFSPTEAGEIQAALAYNRKSIELRGDKAKLNIIEDGKRETNSEII